jgi:uncharacterized protein (TIGR02217 family)
VVWRVDGVPVSFVDNGLGLYTISPAPPSLKLVTASADFDIEARFDVDKFSLELSHSEAGAIGSLPVVEVR